ncbi:hypothetical protein T265_06349 [Opisthorchis viverrini]|uniref:Uncharacterized protein n=1 Tax=Opisthorchis viverrini TaxID=6198 RepID=A0A075ADX9_OPIVI|nr:hypothetical protein T265_06349 [Opisthorchis viverrini]KER26364.1 hypothetical protein T265_06349 [Opisthorchis viverrini]
MVLFDVSSLFTSVDLHSAKTTVAELLDSHGPPSGSLRKEDICELLSLCLTTYFEFNGLLAINAQIDVEGCSSAYCAGFHNHTSSISADTNRHQIKRLDYEDYPSF